ncbi:hypothetical protein HDU93_006543 [Gonapodya sp. JEL0774]|nr:hypothetical protein HDU93_006543 [Gonapodya sp. JEL0774]
MLLRFTFIIDLCHVPSSNVFQSKLSAILHKLSDESGPPRTLYDAVTSPDLINLNLGAPSLDLLPADLMREACAEAWAFLFNSVNAQRVVKEAFSVGRRPETWIGNEHFYNMDHNEAMGKFCMNWQDPTYFLAYTVFTSHPTSFEVVPVPTDDDGMLMDILERGLEARFASKGYALHGEEPRMGQKKFDSATDRYPFLLYCNPTFNNPRSSILHPSRRQKLVELAYKYHLLVICDDVYDFLSYPTVVRSTSEPVDINVPPVVYSYDTDKDDGRIISNGTFSKLFGPGMRLGWVEAGKKIISRFQNSALFISGGSPNQLTSALLIPLIRLGLLDKHITRLCETYASRLHCMLRILDRELPEGIRVLRPKVWGGFFIWIVLPNDWDALEIRGRAVAEKKVAYGLFLVSSTFLPKRSLSAYAIDPSSGYLVRPGQQGKHELH